jgi:hypothetical protein
LFAPAAFLVFLSRSAGARIVSTDLGRLALDRLPFASFARFSHRADPNRRPAGAGWTGLAGRGLLSACRDTHSGRFGMRGNHLLILLLSLAHRLLRLQSHAENFVDSLSIDLVDQIAKHLKRFLFVLQKRIALPVCPQVDTGPQFVNLV